MIVDKDERIFQVFLGAGVVSRFQENIGNYYNSWDIRISGDIHVDYPKLTLAEAKQVKAFLASHAEIRTKIDGAEIKIK